MNVSNIARQLTGAAIAVMLVGCGGSASATLSELPPSQGAAATARARGGCPTSRCIAVANLGSTAESYIVFFARDANGNVHPRGKIEGSLTQLNYPAGIAMDSAGNVYAANASGASITVYAAGAEGDIAPIRTISGSKAQLEEPTGIALDASDRLYVVNYRGNSVTEYSANSNGNVRPMRIISGIKTTLRYPWGIALDTKSNIYVTNGSSSVDVYSAKAKGNVSPPA